MKTVSLRGAAVEPVKNSAMSVRSKYSYTEQLSTMQTAKQLRLSVAVVSHAALPAVMAEVQGLGNTRLRKKIHDMNRQLSSNTSHVCQETFEPSRNENDRNKNQRSSDWQVDSLEDRSSKATRRNHTTAIETCQLSQSITLRTIHSVFNSRSSKYGPTLNRNGTRNSDFILNVEVTCNAFTLLIG